MYMRTERDQAQPQRWRAIMLQSAASQTTANPSDVNLTGFYRVTQAAM